jgi:hypothetical protein
VRPMSPAQSLRRSGRGTRRLTPHDAPPGIRQFRRGSVMANLMAII